MLVFNYNIIRANLSRVLWGFDNFEEEELRDKIALDFRDLHMSLKKGEIKKRRKQQCERQVESEELRQRI